MIWDIRPKLFLNRNLMKTRFTDNLFPSDQIVVKLCTEHSGDTAVPYTAFKNDWAFKRLLWKNDISRDLSLR